jgi:heterodisulfide reductase subunit B2
MCQLNLDVYQEDESSSLGPDYHMPIFYFTQLMGLAFGHSAEELGIGRDFVDPQAALAKIGVEVPAEEPARPPRRPKDDPSLPMPSMPATMRR